MLVAHLAVEAVERLFATVNTGCDAATREPLFDRLHDLADHFAAVSACGPHGLGDRAIAQRMQVRESQLLQLAINVV